MLLVVTYSHSLLHCAHIYIYILLHRKQLHVLALDNSHLQVVYETLSE